MDLNFNKNEDHNKLLVSELKKRFLRVKQGGGAKKIERQHTKGKLTARERIDYLLDSKSDSIEKNVGPNLFLHRNNIQEKKFLPK